MSAPAIYGASYLTFDPAVDDPREYVHKVKFLRAICPAKDKGMLAPRLAMLMKGTAWAQIKGSEAALLSDPEKGVDVLLASVATWEENSLSCRPMTSLKELSTR